MICVAPVHLAVYRNGDCAGFTVIIIKFICNIMFVVESVLSRMSLMTVLLAVAHCHPRCCL